MSEVSQSDTNHVEQAGDGPDDFDAMMEELTASSDNAPAHAAAEGQEDPENSNQNAADQPGSSDPAEAGKIDQAAGQNPPAQQSEDIWASAPPEFREAHERDRASWQHRLNSTQGRLSASDRELARLRRESGAKPEGQSQQQSGQSQDDPLESPELKAFQEEYGEIAAPILKLFKAQQDRFARLEAPVAEVAQQRETEARQTEASIFMTAHPDWEQYRDDERYPEWLSAQPKAVQDAAARAVNVEDGQEAAWLLSQFKASLGTNAPAAEPQQGQRTQQPTADPKRLRQLNAGRDAGASAPPVQSGVPDDFDGAMDAFTAAAERKRKANGQF